MIFMFKVTHCYSHTYSKVFAITVMKYVSLLFISTRISMANVLKNTEAELELLTDIDMLYMVQKGIRGGICHAIHRYTTANNKYMKEYNKGNE